MANRRRRKKGGLTLQEEACVRYEHFYSALLKVLILPCVTVEESDEHSVRSHSLSWNERKYELTMKTRKVEDKFDVTISVSVTTQQSRIFIMISGNQFPNIFLGGRKLFDAGMSLRSKAVRPCLEVLRTLEEELYCWHAELTSGIKQNEDVRAIPVKVTSADLATLAEFAA